MKNKKITNKELLEELINRGYFIIPSDLSSKKEINAITVSVEEPENDVYTTWQKDFHKKIRGSGADV